MFPSTVNEYAARLVAAGVVAQAVLLLATGQSWWFVPLVGGFAARVIAGPRFSLLARLAVRFAPAHRPVAGPPKRFAQAIGLAFSSTAALLWFAGQPGWSRAVLVMLAIAATLEAVASICLACVVYRRLWACEDCDDITDRLRAALAGQSDRISAA